LGLQLKKERRERLTALFNSLAAHFEPGDNNSIRHKTWSGPAVIESIADCFVCPNDLTHNELTRVIRRATYAYINGKSSSCQEFLELAARELASWYKTPLKNYRVWTRLSYRPQQSIRVRFKGHNFLISPQIPLALKRGWKDPSILNSDLPPDIDGGVISISGSFRSETSAGFRLSQLLDEFIAILNFEFSRKLAYMFPEDGRALYRTGPVNHVLLPDGKYSGSVWTKTDFRPTAFHPRTERVKHFETGISRIRKIHKNYKKNPLSDMAIKCASLLDDYYTSAKNTEKLMLVWSCFEHAFSTQFDGARGTYESIARRAAKFDPDPAAREALLITMAGRRNLAAHSHEATGSCHVAQEVAAELAGYMTWIVNWLFIRGHVFTSKQEFLAWVDIPKSKEQLLKRVKLHKMALTYWHPKEANIAEGGITVTVTDLHGQRS
jgi:hypothetical protein